MTLRREVTNQTKLGTFTSKYVLFAGQRTEDRGTNYSGSLVTTVLSLFKNPHRDTGNRTSS